MKFNAKNKAETIVFIVFSMLMLTTISTFAADLNEGAASDSVEIKDAFFSPAEGMDLNKELALRVIYPEKAIVQGIEGTVLVQCTVDAEGRVSEAKVLKDIGGDCGLAATNAVKKIKFQPAVQNGFTQAYTMVIPVHFNLE